MPALSPSGSEASLPKYMLLEGLVSPHVTAPWSVIDSPATLPLSPEPSVKTRVAVGLLLLIVFIRANLSSTFGWPGLRLIWSWTLALLDGSLDPKESLFGCLVTRPVLPPIVDSGGPCRMSGLMRGSGWLISPAIHWRALLRICTSIGSIPAMAHKEAWLLP